MRRTLIVGAVTMAIGLASVPMAMAITFGIGVLVGTAV